MAAQKHEQEEQDRLKRERESAFKKEQVAIFLKTKTELLRLQHEQQRQQQSERAHKLKTEPALTGAPAPGLPFDDHVTPFHQKSQRHAITPPPECKLQMCVPSTA